MSDKRKQMIVNEIKKAVPHIDSITGKILWGLVVNRDIKLPNGEVVSGSFRWWGAMIAEAVGEGDYLDYYMSSGFLKGIMEAISPGSYNISENKLKTELEDIGWEFIESPVYCSKCGKKIDRFSPKAFSIETGKCVCIDCME